MDIVWLVISQALFANEWSNRSEGSWHVVVHLRNMASATLALVSLFMHTSIEKAAIPVNDGELLLAHPSPLLRDKGRPAVLCFDERLHVDSILSDGNHDNNNMLNVRMRRGACFRVITLLDKSIVVYYESMLQSGVSSWSPERFGELFPYPPDSVYHMQTHFELLNTAYQRLHSNDMKMEPSEMTLPLALRMYGKRLQSAMVHYIPATLTHCVVRDGVEIPCMTFREGFIFTMQVRHNRVFVNKVQPTHLHVSAFAALNNVEGCYALPIDEQPASFSITRMAEMMSRGLEYNGESVRLLPQWQSIIVPRDELGDERRELLPFSPFPLVEWKTVVTLMIMHEEAEVDMALTARMQTTNVFDKVATAWEDVSHVRLVSVKDLYESMVELLTKIDKESWEACHEDIPFPGEGCEVYEAELTHMGVFMQIYFVTRPRKKGGDAYFYFNSRAHLKYVLTENPDTPLCKSRYDAWVHKELLVAMEPIHDPTSVGFYNMYPMHTCPDGVVVEATSFDDSESSSLVAQRNQALVKLGAMRRQESLLHQQISNVSGNTFTVEANRTALQETLSNVSNSRMQWQGEAKRLSILIQSARVKSVRHGTLYMGKELKKSGVLGPWEQGKGDLLMGIIKPHGESGKYMHNGLYSVECRDVGVETPYAGVMDFVTVSRCLLREGRRVYVNVSREIYKELRSVEKGLRVEDTDLHKEATSSSAEYFKMQLAAYYVLGSATLDEMRRPCVRLLVCSENRNSAQCEFEVDTETNRNIMLTVELCGEDNVPIVTTLRDEECPLVEGLVCVVGQTCISKPVKLGPGESCLWQ